MTNRIAIVLLSLPLLFLRTAMAQQQLLDSAQAAYEHGDHQKAIQYYDSVANERTSAALLYNIGNCHFKIGSLAQAILHYERALRLAPGNEDVQGNLDLARTLVVDRMNELPTLTLGSSWARLRSGSDPDQWARRSLWSVTSLFALLALYLFVRGTLPRRLLLVLSGLALLASLASIVFAASRHTELITHDQAIIIAPKADAYSEPRQEATLLFVLHEGTKVTLLQEGNGWSEVKLVNGAVGWMPPASLETI